MFDKPNRALARTTSSRSFLLDALRLPSLETEASASEAARMAWWGAAWLGLSFGLSLLAWAGLAISLGRSIFDADKIGLLIFFVVDVVGLALMVVLTLVIRRSQPRWAVVAVFGLLLLSLLGQLLPPRLGLPLIIDAALTYVTLHSVRGAWRVAAFRRGLRTPTQAAKVFD